ncbi:hypothetical protein VOLCADRAFT_74407 [Volvox carteri f. nagariensis]|uniref:Cytochrome b5 heme-binding domain-containing protein n=1 Tax=Volvox carteri f. nagariensis TaxID=3068 RepID=D8TTX2_VOLCA|nr:uncharacterized protein VOLCADRAFT_74407 [Volvox carteri f. nagariensis]EFJ49040.1 hypothetical protein VOLCADRAFT_74407 [Volvox carteri f. nagariensis]|eukprot:XP_002949937.1 hypothetical protein VOLCADRAFT_74407 [Volvox carteri f. nagariensis]
MSSCPFASAWAVQNSGAVGATTLNDLRHAHSDLQMPAKSQGALFDDASFPRTISTPNLASEASKSVSTMTSATASPSSASAARQARVSNPSATTKPSSSTTTSSYISSFSNSASTMSQRLTRRQLRKMGKCWNLSEVRQHARKDDAWIAVDGKVYDITEHLLNHPGWEDSSAISTVLSILAHAGTDCSQEFREIHRPYPVAWRQLQAYYIGDLAPEEEEGPSSSRLSS